MSDLPTGFLSKNNTGAFKMDSNILLCKLCEDLTRTWNTNRDLAMPKTTVAAVKPEMKKHRSAQGLCTFFLKKKKNFKICFY